MGKLLIKDKEIVVPGQILAEGMDFLPAGGAFREENNIVALQVGVINLNGRAIKLIPLNGKYIPKRGDTVIGRVADILFSGFMIDIGYANDAMLNVKDATSDFVQRGGDLTKYFNIGDYVIAKTTNVTKAKQIDLTTKAPGLRKVSGGLIIKVTSVKVPRIIGKAGSMISMIKEKTDCRITVGQNGVVWISGADPDKEKKAVEAIKLIDSASHESGLTDRIKEFLDGSKKEEVKKEEEVKKKEEVKKEEEVKKKEEEKPEIKKTGGKKNVQKKK